MKKWTILLAAILFACSFLMAQQQFDEKMLRKEYVDLPRAKEKMISQPIASFEILDARPDTFCLGLIKDKLPGKKLKKEPLHDFLALAFRSNLQNEIVKTIIPANTFQGDGFNFLMVIKELWMYDNDDAAITDLGTKEGPNTSGLLFRADIYLKRKEAYIPLLKIDSLFIVHTFLQRSKAYLLELAAFTICDRVNIFPTFQAYDKAVKVKTRESIDSFYSRTQQLKLPNFSDTLHQYTFKTFDDFKQGNYISTILSKSSDKLGDYYYKKNADGTESVISDFAFFDKGNFFIKSRNTYSWIYVNRNRIYTIGSKFIIKGSSSIPFFMPLGTSGAFDVYGYGGIEVGDNSRRDYQLMMLDMQTGKIY